MRSKEKTPPGRPWLRVIIKTKRPLRSNATGTQILPQKNPGNRRCEEEGRRETRYDWPKWHKYFVVDCSSEKKEGEGRRLQITGYKKFRTCVGHPVTLPQPPPRLFFFGSGKCHFSLWDTKTRTSHRLSNTPVTSYRKNPLSGHRRRTSTSGVVKQLPDTKTVFKPNLPFETFPFFPLINCVEILLWFNPTEGLFPVGWRDW